MTTIINPHGVDLTPDSDDILKNIGRYSYDGTLGCPGANGCDLSLDCPRPLCVLDDPFAARSLDNTERDAATIEVWKAHGSPGGHSALSLIAEECGGVSVRTIQRIIQRWKDALND